MTNGTGKNAASLITQHIDMARRLARSVARSVPPQKRDELESAALLGLTEAARRYDPTRGEPFGAFAVRRVRGAVLDELRKTDVLTRRARQLARQVDEVIGALELQLGREPSNDEVAGELGIAETQVCDLREGQARLVAFDAAESTTPSHLGADPVERIQKRQEVAAVNEAIDKLSDREREVVDMYYRRGMKLKEIGEELGVTESRVSQMRSAAIKSLRRQVVAMGVAANDDTRVMRKG